MATKTVLIVGGSSDIGRAVGLRYAAAGWNVHLAGRSREAVQRNADDVAARTGAAVPIHDLDILDTGRFSSFADRLPVLPDTLVCVVGALGEQKRAETDIAHAAEVLRANFEGPALLIGEFANRMTARGTGTLVGVSSVAGDRGRASNYVYGSAKAGFSTFLSGLRNRLSKAGGVHVVTVKPGFVRTKMTAGLALPPLLTAEADEVADTIYAAAETRRRPVVYVRWMWRPIMWIIGAIPETIFRRLSL
jgi:short-subunit dehydrogenase